MARSGLRTASGARTRILPRSSSTPGPRVSLDRLMVVSSRFTEQSAWGRSEGWLRTNRYSCWVVPTTLPSAHVHHDAADASSGRMGEAVVYSIHESVDREVGRGHMSSWVGTAVHAFLSRVGAGLIDLLLRYQRPRSGKCGMAGTVSQPARGA